MSQVDVDGWRLYDADEDIQSTNAAFLIGPVVGRVTESSVRILVESARADALLFEVHKLPWDTKHLGITNFLNAPIILEKKVAISAAAPLATEISGLEPEAAYACAVTLVASGETRVARFRTPSDKSVWKFACVSCNSHKYNHETGHWERLASIATSLDAVFHVGDQVYADEDFRRAVTGDEDDSATLPVPEAEQSAWVRSKGLTLDISRVQWASKKPQILENYRNVYRRTWNYPATAAVLASCANCMICDDHEIVDDIGDLPAHSDVTTDSYFIACCGYQVYREYQAQLFQDTEPNKLEAAYYSFKISPRIGVFMTDNRIERSVRKPLQPEGADWTNKTFLGPSQWSALEDALSDEGNLAGTETLFFVTPTPAIFLSHVATALAIKVIDDAIGTWGNKEYAEEQERLLTRLSDWQGARGERAVCILAGDIHVGGFSSAEMMEEGSILNQVTSSAICNEPTTQLGRMTASMARGVMRFDAFLQGFKVTHRDWVFDPNFALIDMELVGDGGPPHMTGTLFHTKGHPRIRNFGWGEPLHKAQLRATEEAKQEDDAESDVRRNLHVRKEHPQTRDPNANRAAEAAHKTAQELTHVPLRARCTCSVS